MAACTVEALTDMRFINIRPAQANDPECGMAGPRSLRAAAVVMSQSHTSELLLRLGKGDAASRIAYALLEFYVRPDAVGSVRDARV